MELCWEFCSQEGVGDGSVLQLDVPFYFFFPGESLDLTFLLVAGLFSLQGFTVHQEGNPFFVSDLP